MFDILPFALPVVTAGSALLCSLALRFYATHFQKAGPNDVLIISGRPTKYIDADTGESVTKNFAIFHGGGTFVLPIREKVDRLSVELMTLEILTPEFFTKHGIPIVVDAIAQIKVMSDDPLRIAMAAEMFLSKSTREMNQIAHQMMQGHLRAVISTLPFEEIHANPEVFAQSVQRLTAAELDNMGIAVVSFTIRKIMDPSGYLKALGRPHLAEITKTAELGEARAQRDSRVGTAEATKEATIRAAAAKEASELARIEVSQRISAAQAAHDEQALNHQAEVAAALVRKEVAAELARARMNLQLEAEQRKVAEQRMQREIEIEHMQVEKTREMLKYEVTEPANAEAARVLTAARTAQEEARLQLEIRAESIRSEGEAKAASIRLQGEAEAARIRAIQLAEAEGMAAKADAWKQYGQAAISQLYIEKLPELAAAVSKPLSKIEKITMVHSGSDTESMGFSRITQGITDVIAQLPGLAQTLGGLDLPEMIAPLTGSNKDESIESGCFFETSKDQ